MKKDNIQIGNLQINYKIVIDVLLVISVLTAGVAAVIYYFPSDSTPVDNNSASLDSTVPDDTPVKKNMPTSFRSIRIVPGVDFLTGEVSQQAAIDEIKAVIDTAAADGFDSVNISVHFDGGVIFETELAQSPCGDLLDYIYAYAHENSMSVLTTVDLGLLAQTSIVDRNDVTAISSILSSSSLTSNSDMLLLTGYCISSEDVDYTDYSSTGETDNFKNYVISRLSSTMKLYYETVSKAAPTLPVGVECDSVYTADRSFTDEYRLLDDGFADVVEWLRDGYADFAIVSNPYSTENKEQSFADYAEKWHEFIGSYQHVYFKLAYTLIGSDEPGWEMTDQIVKQLMALNELGVTGFTIDSYGVFVGDKTESRQAVIKYMADELKDNFVLTNLSITSPNRNTFTTSESSVLFSGASDPAFELLFNGKPVEREEFGFFSFNVELQPGLNSFVLEHKGVSETFSITYQHLVVKEYFPSENMTLDCGAQLGLSVTALAGSTVTASFNGKTYTLTETVATDDLGNVTEYSNYTARIEMPTGFTADTSLGNVVFRIVSAFGTETKTGGRITVRKDPEPPAPSEPDVSSGGASSGGTSSGNTSSSGTTSAPQTDYDPFPKLGDDYIDVGNTYIAMVNVEQGETFKYGDSDAWSRPTVNYLPKGTVDYCFSSTDKNPTTTTRRLRYGNMMYESDLVISRDTLPNRNTINVANVSNGGRHTTITLDVLWKAPFRFELAPQKYNNEAFPAGGDARDYRISSATYTYVDITFCYATAVSGEIDLTDNPVFSKAEWFKNTSDYTLRLHLKKTGMFYGWTAEYNTQGQLVFSFLNPVKITAENNAYGYSLKGVTVLLDVGHGDKDSGAAGFNPNYHEKVLNLILAKKVREQLESIGATVIMTREGDTNPSSSQRQQMVMTTKPDFTLAIHRNSSSNSKARGFASYHFNAFSSAAAHKIYDATNSRGLYKNSTYTGVKWHVYYTCRTTACPVVLTENGFVSNSSEYADLLKDDFNNQCAAALVQGIVDYFVSIQ